MDMNMDIDDILNMGKAYDAVCNHQELEDLIEIFSEWLADNYDDSTPPSSRFQTYQNAFDGDDEGGLALYDDEQAKRERYNNDTDRYFEKQYQFINNMDVNSAEGIMKVWEWWLKTIASKDDPSVICYSDKVTPYLMDTESDGTELWGLEAKI